MQREALTEIDGFREAGHDRALVISATGTGKTILSALSVRSASPDRMLFVVHREQILDRTIQEYRRVVPGDVHDFGKLSGTRKDMDAKFLFATVQTLSRPGVLDQFAPEHFDFVVVDEAHRATAAGHRRVMEYFQPKFMLGMTATPERLDGDNVFELFNYNVAYEIRLNQALEADMLSPFHYYGVTDVTFDDGTTTSDESDIARLTSKPRVDHILRELEKYGQAGIAPRGLIFVSRKEEARVLSDALNARTLRGHTLRTIALTGEDTVPIEKTSSVGWSPDTWTTSSPSTSSTRASISRRSIKSSCSARLPLRQSLSSSWVVVSVRLSARSTWLSSTSSATTPTTT